MKKIGVLLSGCGVYDGAEIQESVLALLAIQEQNAEYICVGINENQHHVINHTTGEEMKESRNMLIEAARIARGEIIEINTLDINSIDALVIPGGFGSAKNLTKWAFEGPNGKILSSVKKLIISCIENNKPIAALCVSPVVIAKALEGTIYQPQLTIGSTTEKSPYEINSFKQGLEAAGSTTIDKNVQEINIDENLKIVTAPCYMMDAKLIDVRKNISQAITALIQLS